MSSRRWAVMLTSPVHGVGRACGWRGSRWRRPALFLVPGRFHSHRHAPGRAGAPWRAGAGQRSALSTFFLAGEGGLQSLLGNMSHSQLMQLIGPAGLGGLGNVCSPGPLAAAQGCALAFGLFPVSR